MAAMRVIQSYLKEAYLQCPLSHGESVVDRSILVRRSRIWLEYRLAPD